MEIKRKGVLLRQITEDLDAAIARCFNIKDRSDRTLPALVYRILLPNTAVTAYAIGLRKLSANLQLFDGARTAVSL